MCRRKNFGSTPIAASIQHRAGLPSPSSRRWSRGQRSCDASWGTEIEDDVAARKSSLIEKALAHLPGGIMKLPRRFWFFGGLLLLSYSLHSRDAWSQEKIRLSHSALESSNAVWYLAQDR